MKVINVRTVILDNIPKFYMAKCISHTLVSDVYKLPGDRFLKVFDIDYIEKNLPGFNLDGLLNYARRLTKTSILLPDIKTIRFNNKSDVISIFSLDNMQRVFIAFANKRVIVLNTYMYNISVLQKATDDDECLIYATKLFQHNMYYLAYVTSKDDNKNVHAFYETGIGNVTAGQVTLSKLIKTGSDVVTYDELFATPSNIELWSQDVLRLGSMQSKYKHLSQR